MNNQKKVDVADKAYGGTLLALELDKLQAEEFVSIDEANRLMQMINSKKLTSLRLAYIQINKLRNQRLKKNV